MLPKIIIIKNLFKLLYRLQQNYYAKYLLTILAIVGGYFALIVTDSFTNHQHQTVCFFKIITGIPCPGCGMGRATLALMHGNIPLSFSYNILCIPFSIAMIVSFFWAIADLIQHKESFYLFMRRDMNVKFKVLLFSLLLIDWIVNIIRLKN